jgi:hypothetical protein
MKALLSSGKRFSDLIDHLRLRTGFSGKHLSRKDIGTMSAVSAA